MGAIQQRRQLLDHEPTRGFECTFGVENVEQVRERILAAGGRILMEKFTISIDASDARHGTLAMAWGTFRWTVPIVVQ